MKIPIANVRSKICFTGVRMTLAFSNNEETRKKIVDTSAKIQEVLELDDHDMDIIWTRGSSSQTKL